MVFRLLYRKVLWKILDMATSFASSPKRSDRFRHAYEGGLEPGNPATAMYLEKRNKWVDH